MWTFIICVVVLCLGYLIYSRIVDKVFCPTDQPTPAYTMADGLDYAPLPTWKAFVIQLLNIAGTGPIFGAIMGALWGPVVFIWIVAGTILGGAVHDYMSGMISLRHKGEAVPSVIQLYLGKLSKPFMLVLTFLLLLMVSAVFSRSAADILTYLTGVNVWIWMCVILAYFILSAYFPIDKLIGKIYPVFGILLIVMAVIIVIGVVVSGHSFPEMSLDNMHPSGTPMWPYMFVTVACGAISGFHATQSPLMARCIMDERKGRHVFYGAMVVEGIIALVWAAAAIAFFGDTFSLQHAINSDGVAGVVYQISDGVAGTVGGVMAIIGVVICPITSGDTALRCSRLIVGEQLHIDQKPLKTRALTLAPLVTVIVILTLIDFTVLWRYFSWLNQTLAAVVLWLASMYLLIHVKRKILTMITALPATFMTAVSIGYILAAKEGIGLSYEVAVGAAIIVSAAIFALFLYRIATRYWEKMDDGLPVGDVV